MSTSLAAQLRRIAAKSTNSLNLKAQRTAHAQSLIFEPKLAATQGFDTIFQICQEGFQELCLLDPRFVVFGRSIFSEQSKTQDRTQMTAEENEVLNKALEAFMDLVGGRLLLKPAVKAMDWLVRRFRVHEYNISSLLLTFLPYHGTPIFPTVLSILPANIPLAFRFLHPYIKSLVCPPRHTIVYSATNTLEFFAALNAHVLRVSKARFHYRALLSFWAGIVTEAVAGMLDNAHFGRGTKQQQNQQDVLLHILPLLNEALAIKKVPDLRIGCYTLMTVLASKSSVGDTVLVKMMEAVTAGWTHDTRRHAMLCLSIMAQERESTKLPKSVFKAIMSIDDVADELVTLSLACKVEKLTLGLMLSCIRQLVRTQDSQGLRFVKKMLDCSILDESQISSAVEEILRSAKDFDITLPYGRELQSQLADLLARLTDSKAISGITEKVIKDCGIDIEDLEARLQIVLTAPDRSAVEPAKDDNISDPPSKPKEDTFEAAIASIPTRTAYEISFFSRSKSYVFSSLSHAFIVSAMSVSHLNAFTELPVLRKGLALSEPLYLTFFVRMWCGQYPVLARTAALQVVSEYFSTTDKFTVDVQALLPYVLVALADSSAKVRRAASEVLLQLGRLYETLLQKEPQEIKIWGAEDIYGQGEEVKSIHWLSPKETAKIIEKVLLPGLEEFVLDSEHISRSVEYALRGVARTGLPGSKAPSAEMKTALRAALFTFLGSHIVTTPFYSVKLRLLGFLEQVEKVGKSSRTKVLLPLLHSWVSTDDVDLNENCKTEGIDREEMDRAIIAIVLPSDRDGVNTLLSIMKGEARTTSPSVTRAATERIRAIWPKMKPDMQLACLEVLLALSLTSSSSPASHHVQILASDTLRSIQLPTTILVTMLENLPTAAAVAGDNPRPTKRRRMSNSDTEAVTLHGSNELTVALRTMAFVLELVESSQPEKHRQLLPILFRVLGELPMLKSQVDSELAYLQNLVLGSLLALVSSFKSGAAQSIDRAAVRVDLLVDCVRATANPQVQQTALLLIADLARVAPELILHSIMPIFTFMGASVLRQDDEYSAFVINRTIDEVVPPLVGAMKKQKKDALSGSSELLLSFVAAFEHIPWHRRYPLFESLIGRLGPEDFLFALLGLLADRYAAKKDVQDFTLGLAARFSAKIQLVTVHKYLELVFDTLRPKRGISDLLLNIGPDQGRSPTEVAHELLKLVPHLLGAKRLVSAVSKTLQQNDEDAADIRSIYASILQQTLSLGQQTHDQRQLSSTCGIILETLLALLSTSEFLDSTQKLLHDSDSELRRKFLRSLEIRIRSGKANHPTARDALLQFLPELTKVLAEAPEALLKLAALECVDQISERFGKKNKEAIAAAARVISGAQCLGHADSRLSTLAILCLASTVEILDQDIIPILPETLPRVYEHLRKSIKDGSADERLHNSVYTFVNALLMHVPWIITGGNLDSILKLSFESSNANMGQSSDYSRKDCLQLLAKQTAAKDLFVALERNWVTAVAEGVQAVKECLNVLSVAIEKQPKSIVARNSSTLSNIFRRAFDLRRIVSSAQGDETYDDEDIQEAETATGDVAIKMVYKLNDATFRPLFTNLLEWASTGLPKDDRQGRRLRLTSLFTFLQILFSSLKSIVTNYASHVIDIAVDALHDVDLTTSDSVALARGVLRTLRAAFEHDQDDFWQSPSHFKAISGPLLSNLRHACSATFLASEVIPTITELAVAADSADNHKEMNATIMKQMRSDEAQVRLAAVKCEQSLTARLGEEWLALLPEMLPFISELQEDDDEAVERESNRWIAQIEGILGESLDSMLQ